MSTLPTIHGLGTSWWVEIFDELPAEKLQSVYDDLQFFISEFDNKYSRFKPESIISNLNTTRRLQNPDPETIALLKYGIMLYHNTNEVFNFLVGERLEANGYDALYSFTPKDRSVTTPDPTDAISIAPKRIILSLGQVDIGGYGKGYLIDKVAERLKKKHHLEHFLINGGGDMYGTSEIDGRPIVVYLEHPTEPSTYLEETTILNEGFAASSTQKRRFENAGKVYTHIVDTKTGESSLNTTGVFIKAPTAALADAWATTLLISAPENHTSALEAASIDYAIFNPTESSLTKSSGF